MKVSFTALLPGAEERGFLRTDHRFMIHRLHFHHFIAGGNLSGVLVNLNFFILKEVEIQKYIEKCYKAIGKERQFYF